MARDIDVGQVSRCAPTIGLSTSTSASKGAADRSEGRADGSKNPRPRMSLGDFTKHFRRLSKDAATPLDNFIEKNPEFKPFRDDSGEQSVDQDEFINRMLGKAKSRGEAQHIRRMGEDATQMPAPLRIKDKDPSTVVERFKRKAREAFPQKRKPNEEETPVHRHIARLIQETKVEYANLGARTLFEGDRRPCFPSAWMRSSSLPRGWRPLSPLNPEWSLETASRRFSCSGAYRRPAIPVGVSELSAASAIRGGMRPVYSNNPSRASSIGDSGRSRSLGLVPEPLRLTSGSKEADTVAGRVRKVLANPRLQPDVHEGTTPARIARKGSILSIMKIFESSSDSSSKRLPRFGSHHVDEREGRSLKRWSDQEARAEREEQARHASQEKPPVLQVSSRGEDDYPAEDWSRRLSRVMEVYMPADQEKMAGRPAFSTAPEVVQAGLNQPQSAYEQYLTREQGRMPSHYRDDSEAVPPMLGTLLVNTNSASGFSGEDISPMTRIKPQELEAPAMIYELADGSDTASIGGESFETAHEWYAETGSVVAKGEPAGQRAGRLDSGMTDISEVEVVPVKGSNITCD